MSRPSVAEEGESVRLPLFRDEVRHARGALYGEIVFRGGHAGLGGTIAMVVFLAPVLRFVLGGEVPRTVSVRGSVVPVLGLARVNSPVGGTVAQLLVTQGMRVNVGEPIARVFAKSR